MKKLQLNGTTGGFPLFQNDLEFIQNSYTSIVDQLAQTFGGPRLVLSGIVQGATFSAGIVLIDGIIYETLPFPVLDFSSKTWHKIETTDNILDPTTYKDASVKNTHITTKLELLTPSGSPNDLGIGVNDLDFINSRFAEVLMESSRLVNLLGDSFNLTQKLTKTGVNVALFMENIADNGWTSTNVQLASNFVVDEPIQWRKHGERIEWRGQGYFTGTTGATIPLITGFGALQRPTITKYLPVGINSGGLAKFNGHVQVTSGGQMNIRVDTDGTNPSICLDGLIYYKR